MVTQYVRVLGVTCLVCAAACKPELAGRPSLVRDERVLALRSSPAEALPGARVTYDALFVGPDGDGAADTLSWALCNERKALTESGSIARQCLQYPELAQDGVLTALDSSADGAAQAEVPRQACETFGPTPKTPKPGEPNLRPVDPDTTGGYYQPVRVAVDGEITSYAVGMTRLTCALGGATQEQSAEYNRRRRANENPRLDALALLRDDGEEQPLAAAQSEPTLTVAAGERVQLSVRWPECPDEQEQGCGGSEAYVHFDPLTRQLVKRRELMRVSWFASDGAFDHERTGQSAEAAEPGSHNVWEAPADPAQVRLWVVLRDDRGGVGWSSYRLQVE